MKLTKKVSGGRRDRADIEIILNPSKKRDIEVNLESSVQRLFGNHITNYIKEYLSGLGITPVRVRAVDDGALDFVIKSRIEAALYRYRPALLEKCSFGKRKKRKRVVELRRTRLYLPGNTPYLMEGGGLFGADVIILDLEDAVSQNEKIDARFLVRNALSNLDFGNAEVIVRINPFLNGGEEDVKRVLSAQPDAIMLPKTNRPEDVTNLDKLLE